MPKFTVQLNITRTITVIADGEEEAREEAWALAHGRPGFGEILRVEVTEVAGCRHENCTGATHQPADAFLYVPTVHRFPKPEVVILAETSEAYRWECDECGQVGTRAELEVQA